MIVLKIVGPYGKNGWQDPDTGTEHFNDRVTTPYGDVGKLRVDKGRIVQADPVVLVKTPLVNDEYTTFVTSPLEAILMKVQAKNGTVEYLIDPDDVKWEDDEDVSPLRVGTFTVGDWSAE